MENNFKNNFLRNCKAAIENSSALRLGHAGLEGNFREILHGHMLRPILPPEISLGNGKLVTSDGKMSPQVDAVLYSKSILPPFLYNESSGLFPAESCLYSIEVKTTLRAADVKSAIANAKSIAAMPLLDGMHMARIEGEDIVSEKSLPTPRPINALFAYSSDLTSDPSAELERYKKHDPDSLKNPAIVAICIIGRGYWYHSKEGWKFVPATNELDEIIQFLSGIANTIPKLLVAKGRPYFGFYLTSDTAKHHLVK